MLCPGEARAHWPPSLPGWAVLNLPGGQKGVTSTCFLTFLASSCTYCTKRLRTCWPLLQLVITAPWNMSYVIVRKVNLCPNISYPPSWQNNTPWGKAFDAHETIVFDSSVTCSCMTHLDTIHLREVQLKHMIRCDAARLFVIHCATQLIVVRQMYTYI